ncbi:hypothetical protein [Halomonas salipaludis]|nr:hypothetical protein [Halomonas salipaludis]
MNIDKKEVYSAPVVVALGSPAEITQAGGRPNADVEQGQDGTAFKPGS